MYCENCGKEVAENVRFCPGCGNKIETNHVPLTFESKESGPSNWIGMIPIIMLIILPMSFISVAYSRYESNVNAFDWLSDSAKSTGILMYWGVAALFSITSIECISAFIKTKMQGGVLIANSIVLLFYALMLQIGSIACDDWSDSDMSIILYRIFGTYKRQIGISYFTAIIVLVFGIFMIRIHESSN